MTRLARWLRRDELIVIACVVLALTAPSLFVLYAGDLL